MDLLYLLTLCPTGNTFIKVEAVLYARYSSPGLAAESVIPACINEGKVVFGFYTSRV